MTSRLPRILVVHPDRLCAQGIAAALSIKGGWPSVEGVATSIEAADLITDQPPASPVDFLLVDWGLPPGDAVRLVRFALRRQPQLRAVMLGTEAADSGGASCAAALPQGEGLTTLVNLLGRMWQTDPPFAPPEADTPAALTHRQQEILELIEQGLSNKEIARHLGRSLHTVKNHIHNLLGRLAVDSRYAAVGLGVNGHPRPRPRVEGPLRPTADPEPTVGPNPEAQGRGPWPPPPSPGS
jgi:DNA-binding NarL/FixJ family response regulator